MRCSFTAPMGRISLRIRVCCLGVPDTGSALDLMGGPAKLTGGQIKKDSSGFSPSPES